ncbi:dihydrofolate reductase family protein [Labedaea rhizosphaerae]|uniref:Dihydrofolate reductase n=1 Tax=Labedaea rhizosphaerae TaxID=598644 RepID=A0A4R6S9W9_LABRH|nr:dihydrofolate reductase family protein [Labedaea rhizosphaerae]TDP96700.1 dihydrofolate reductase [Labedaea rhizosphaerae]
MGLVICDMSISLDGYVTGPNASKDNPFGDGAGSLHDWMFKNPIDSDRQYLEDAIAHCGAVVMGRTSFDKTVDAWGPDGPLEGIRSFVVTHEAPTGNYPGYTFVTDGVASAIEQAKAAAGDKWVGLHGATVMQQGLPLGLVDEIYVHVVPLLLGGGTPLFAALDSAIELERIETPSSPAVDHLRYRVVK